MAAVIVELYNMEYDNISASLMLCVLLSQLSAFGATAVRFLSIEIQRNTLPTILRNTAGWIHRFSAQFPPNVSVTDYLRFLNVGPDVHM